MKKAWPFFINRFLPPVLSGSSDEGFEARTSFSAVAPLAIYFIDKDYYIF